MATKKRSEINDKYKWKLSDIIVSDAQWEILFGSTKERIPQLGKFRGQLNDKIKLSECLKLNDDIMLDLEKLYVYARMNKDENVASTVYQSLSGRADSLFVEFSSTNSYIVSELSELSEDYLNSLVIDPGFADYDYTFREIIRNKKHILTDKEEKLLALTGDVTGMFSDIFSVLDNVDIKFSDIEVDGKKVGLTHSTYSTFLQNTDRNIRKSAYTAMYKEFKNLINTIAANYSGNVKKDIFYSRARNYSSCLNKALEGDDVPESVYTNLLRSVGNNLSVLHKYVEYRKKTLDLKTMYMYDMYVPIIEGAELKLKYEDAYKTVIEGLEPLGEEYRNLLQSAFTDGWIDVHETQNKRSGAYSWGVYGVHPYVLLNYQKTTHDIFTIAHEMGHAIHSYYSNLNQCYNKAGYKIFVAEVASTVNEVLLLKHLLYKQRVDKKLKKYLLSYYLEMFRTTMFRQTMFSEFEYNAHKMQEDGNPLNQENLSSMYLELNRKYYGKAVEHDDDSIMYEWARIPHFYNSFYVYKYATGLTAAVNIADNILKEGEPAVRRYKEKFLSAGGSKSPYEILKDAGVDLATDTPFLVAMEEFTKTLEALINE